MTRSAIVAAALATALLAGGAAWAGVKRTSIVTVNQTSRSASGSLGSARNSTDTVQQIGCHLIYNSGSTWAQCYARSATNVYGTCVTTVPEMVNTARALTGDSHLSFNWDANSNCTYINVTQSSEYEPKK